MTSSADYRVAVPRECVAAARRARWSTAVAAAVATTTTSSGGGGGGERRPTSPAVPARRARPRRKEPGRDHVLARDDASERGRSPEADRRVQRVAERREGEARRTRRATATPHAFRAGLRQRRPARPRAARGQRDPADDRQPVRRSRAGVRQGRQLRHVRLPRRGSSTTTRVDKTCCGRCRSTCRTRSSTTTRPRSPRPASTPNKPPTTLDEMRADVAEDRRHRRHAVRLRRSSSTRGSSSSGLAKAGKAYVDNGNGRDDARDRRSTFDNDDGRERLHVDRRHGRRQARR